ncbi:hypothetical protein CDD81_1105 [Ophiocordyceps australis]|uniref:PPM-type phosphatase domain-containing protein n=1 Tax=Ophiocordyceps australis TaxID=1399860 RepID=A0A2C5XFL8_9HYPO|nr:hypothetical protein CDD81_1105 [Ophiocordyceps australis]
MFGGGSTSSAQKTEGELKAPAKPSSTEPSGSATSPSSNADQVTSGEKRSGNGSPQSRTDNGSLDKKRRSSGVGGKASSLLASARNSLGFSQGGRGSSDLTAHTPLQKLGKQDLALAVPQGQHNNSAGESVPGPMSSFRVGVWEDRNKKCRRTMEDTHAFLYNFLDTPASTLVKDTGDKADAGRDDEGTHDSQMVHSDNGYFAIFDGHAGTFAADWCGKKLHIILEDIIRKNPKASIPELLDLTFTTVDSQLERLPVKNSGCTAAIAVLRWEDRVPNEKSVTGSQPIASASTAASKHEENFGSEMSSCPNDPLEQATNKDKDKDKDKDREKEKQTEKDKEKDKDVVFTMVTEVSDASSSISTKTKPRDPRRLRVLYTANVGDARIILCRSGRALRLSYDHKGSDENEGKRIANAGGLILNNRVNGVLAVTRALGDAYMKDLVTGHPYTTETVVQADLDEFIIIACDGLWDVCTDQEAVDLVRNIADATEASKALVDHALSRFSTDNLSCMIVRFLPGVAQQNQGSKVDYKEDGSSAKVSEVEKIVMETKKKIAEGSASAVGVSPSNGGRGYDGVTAKGANHVSTSLGDLVQQQGVGSEDAGDAQANDKTQCVVSGNT